MAIPASEIVSITPRVLKGGGSELVFNGLFLTCSNIAPVDTLLSFTSATEVAEYFGYDSNEHRGATSYFNGYDNSMTKPSTLFVFRHIKKDVAPYLRGAPSSDVAALLNNLRSISNGALTVVLGPETLVLEGLDFSRIGALSDCAQILQDAINDAGHDNEIEAWEQATVTYSSLTAAFTITLGVTGPEMMVDYAQGSLADVLGLSQAKGAILSRGAYARTYYETLDTAFAKTGNFATFTTCEEITDLEEAKSLASWTNDQYSASNMFLYVFYTTDSSLNHNEEVSANSTVGLARVGSATVVNSLAGRAIAEHYLSAAYEGVAGVYGGIEHAALFMSVSGCIDWDTTSATVTYAFKSQAGLSANVTDAATARTLDELKLSYIGNYATRNDNFVFTMHGKMYGAYGYIDLYVNAIWLNDALQVALMGFMKNTGRVPYNQSGMALLNAACMPTIQRAIKNGVIETGVTIDDATKATLSREAGSDISTDLTNNGYKLIINAPDATTRQNRESPEMKLWYTYGGAVHKLSMTATAMA